MIEEQLYREELLEVFRNPSNRGELGDPDLEARAVNPLCGDEIRIQLKIRSLRALRPQSGLKNSKLKIIDKAAFSGNGCAISQASASLLAESIEGQKLSEIKKLKMNDILKLIGINPTPARLGCALLSLEVLKEALQNSTLRI